MLCFTFGDVGSSLSQAFLPAFRNEEGGFDTSAARPSILKVLQCTWCISATVMALAATVILGFAGQITCEPAVVANMRQVLPILLSSLALHGTAVTLEVRNEELGTINNYVLFYNSVYGISYIHKWC